MSFTNLSGKFISLNGKLVIDASVAQFSMRSGITGFSDRFSNNQLVVFEVGMTWGSFVCSSYNNNPLGRFSIREGKVVLYSWESDEDYLYVYTASGSLVSSEDEIIRDVEYVF